MSDFDDFVQYRGDGSQSCAVGNASGSVGYRQTPSINMPVHGGSVSAAVPGSVLSSAGAYSIGGLTTPFVPLPAVGYPVAAHSTPSGVVAAVTAIPTARQMVGVRSDNLPRVAVDVLPGPGARTPGWSAVPAVSLHSEGALSLHSAEAATSTASRDKSDGRPKFTKEDFARKHRTSDALSQIDAFKVTAKKDVEHRAGQHVSVPSLPGFSSASSSGNYSFSATAIQAVTYQPPSLPAVVGQSLVAHDGIAQQGVLPFAMPTLWAMTSQHDGTAVLQLQQDHQRHHYQQQQQQQHYATAAPSQSSRHSEHTMLPHIHCDHTAQGGHIAYGPLPGNAHARNASDLRAVSASVSNSTSGVLPTNLTASEAGVLSTFSNGSFHVNSAVASSAAIPIEHSSAAVAACSLPGGGASFASGNVNFENPVKGNGATVDRLVSATGNVSFMTGIDGTIGFENKPAVAAPLDDFDDFISYDSPMGPASNSRSPAANYAAIETSSQLTSASAFAVQPQPAMHSTSPQGGESVFKNGALSSISGHAGRSIPDDSITKVRDLHRPTKTKYDAPMQKVQVVFKRYVDPDPTLPLPLNGDSAGLSFGKNSRLNKAPPVVRQDPQPGVVSTEDDQRIVNHTLPFTADIVNSSGVDADFGDFQFLPADSAAKPVSLSLTATPTLSPVIGRPAVGDTLKNGLNASAIPQMSGSVPPTATSLSATLVSLGHSSNVESPPATGKIMNSTTSIESDWLISSGKTPKDTTSQLHAELPSRQPQPPSLLLQQSSANCSEAESDEFIAFQSFLPSQGYSAQGSPSESLSVRGSHPPHQFAAARTVAAETAAHPKQSSKAANWGELSCLSEFAESEGNTKSTDLMGETSVFDSVPHIDNVHVSSQAWGTPNAATAMSASDDTDDFADFAAFQNVEVGSSLTESTAWHASAAAAAAPKLPTALLPAAPDLSLTTHDEDAGWGSFLEPVGVAPTAVAAVAAGMGYAGALSIDALTGRDDGFLSGGLSPARGGSKSTVLHQRHEETAVALDLAATPLSSSMTARSPSDIGSSFLTSDVKIAPAYSSHAPKPSVASSHAATASATAASAVSSRARHVDGSNFFDDDGFDGMQPPPLDDYDHDWDGSGETRVGASSADEDYDIAFGSFASYVGTAAQSAAEPSERRTAAAEDLLSHSTSAATATSTACQYAREHETDSAEDVCASRKRSGDREEVVKANANILDVLKSAEIAVTPTSSTDHMWQAANMAVSRCQMDGGKVDDRSSRSSATQCDASDAVASSHESASASARAVDGEFNGHSAVCVADATKTDVSGSGGSCTATAVIRGSDTLGGRGGASGLSLASLAADSSGRQNDVAAYDDSSSESWGFAASPPPLPPDPSADDYDDDWGTTSRTARDRSVSPASSAERDSVSGWAEFGAAPGLSESPDEEPAAHRSLGTTGYSLSHEPPALAGIDEVCSDDDGWDELHSASAMEPSVGNLHEHASFTSSVPASVGNGLGGSTVMPPTDQSVANRFDWLSAADNGNSSTDWASEWATPRSPASPERPPTASDVLPPPAELPMIEPPDHNVSNSDDDDDDDWAFSSSQLPIGSENSTNKKPPDVPDAQADDAFDDEEWSFGQSVPTGASSYGEDDWAFQSSSSFGAAAAEDATGSRSFTGTGAATARFSTANEKPCSIPQSTALKVLQIAFAASAAVQWASLAVAASDLPRTVGSSLRTCRLWTKLCDLDSSPAMTDVVWSGSTGCRRMLDALPLADVPVGMQSGSAGECSPFGSVSRSEGRSGMLMPVSLMAARTTGRSSAAASTREATASLGVNRSASSSTAEASQPQQQQSSYAKNSSASSSDSDWMFANPLPPEHTAAAVVSSAVAAVSLMPTAQFDLNFLESLSSSTPRPLAAADSGSAARPLSLPSDLDLSFFETPTIASGPIQKQV